MSEKKWYKLVFKQLQPLHIGAGSYGVINETRIFIPGWTMWGALTKAYGNFKKWKKGDFDKEDNKKIFEEISCFYPCFNEKGDNPLLPAYKNGEFYLGDYSESEFRAKFVDTFISTAVLPGSRMAKDESLHETNVILPGVKSDFLEYEKEKQLYWVGILNIEEDKKIEFLKENELEITVGGDSKYGLGKMRLTSVNEIDDKSKDFLELFKSNYLSVKNDLSGKVELIVEIKRIDGAGVKIEKNNFCYMPGHGKHNLKLIKGILKVN